MLKPIVQITLKVKGRDWKFMLLTDKAFNKVHNPNDENNAAMTLPTKYEVHFSKSDWNIIDIRHELGHVFYAMAEVASSNLSPDQVEETMCSIIGQNYHEIGLLSDRVAECFFNK